MEIVNLEDYRERRFNTAIALGNFDGVHMGHQSLINSMIEISKEKDLKPGILLFENHTKKIVEGNGPELLSSRQDKLNIFLDLGIEVVYSAQFNEKIMTLSPEEFVKEILIDQLNVKLITVGFDYKFGHKASGNIETLKILAEKYGFEINIIEPEYLDGLIISSTEIRSFLKKGMTLKANQMLGRNYAIKGKVIHGKSLGRKLGFPTANIELSDEFLIPKFGVYVTNAIIDNEKFRSVSSIGKNPTFNEEKIKIECHIMGFNQSIYGKIIEIELVEYIRDEIKFDNLEDLKIQIKKDVEFAKTVY